jgi:hypothetical protein
MRFVLVAGRTPTPQSFCTFCCDPIGDSYLRDVSTRLPYCDQICFAMHSENPAQVWESLMPVFASLSRRKLPDAPAVPTPAALPTLPD